MRSCIILSLILFSCASLALDTDELSSIGGRSLGRNDSNRLVRRGKKSKKGPPQPQPGAQKHKSAANAVGRSRKSADLAQIKESASPQTPKSPGLVPGGGQQTPQSPGMMPARSQQSSKPLEESLSMAQQSPKSPGQIPTGTETWRTVGSSQQRNPPEEKKPSSPEPVQERVPSVSQQPGSARRKRVASPPVLPESSIQAPRERPQSQERAQPPRGRQPRAVRARSPSPTGSPDRSRSVSTIIFSTSSGHTTTSSESYPSSARSSRSGSRAPSREGSSEPPASPGFVRSLSPSWQRAESPTPQRAPIIGSPVREGETLGEMWHRQPASVKAAFGTIPPPQPRPPVDMKEAQRWANLLRKVSSDGDESPRQQLHPIRTPRAPVSPEHPRSRPTQPAQAVSAAQGRGIHLRNELPAAVLDRWVPGDEPRIGASSSFVPPSQRPILDAETKSSLEQSASRARSSPIRIPGAELGRSFRGSNTSPEARPSSGPGPSSGRRITSPGRTPSPPSAPPFPPSPDSSSDSSTSRSSSPAPDPQSPPIVRGRLGRARDITTGIGSLQESRAIIDGLRSRAHERPDTSVAGRKNRAVAASAVRVAEELKQKARTARRVSNLARGPALEAIASGKAAGHNDIDAFIEATKQTQQTGWHYSKAEALSAAALAETRRYGDAAKAYERADRAYMRQVVRHNYGSAVDHKWHYSLTGELQRKFPGSPAMRRAADGKRWYRDSAKAYKSSYRDYKTVREELGGGSSSSESERDDFADILGERSRSSSPEPGSPGVGSLTRRMRIGPAMERLEQGGGTRTTIISAEGSKVWQGGRQIQKRK